MTSVKPEDNGLLVTFESPDGSFTDMFDKVLVAVGRRPNGAGLGLPSAGVNADERGFIAVGNQ